MHAVTAPTLPRSGRTLPLDTRFTLGPQITAEQWAFLDQNGFLIFDQVASVGECEAISAEADRIAAEWLASGRTVVYGIPLFTGKGVSGEPFISRLPFTSVFSETIKAFVHDARFTPIRDLIGVDTRVGDTEKDGVVINRYLNVPGSAYPRLGWHTDGLRDLAYLRMPRRMLNVGLHFDAIGAADGGLRLIPGSHDQGFRDMAFRKAYFLDHRPDPEEIAIETRPGDLTIHDGRLWHRVQQSPHSGARSLRRSMYLPYLTDAYQPKREDSPMPIYHHLGRVLRRFKGVL
ncbi:MAG TPA: phytanoyl-CoA dioxygenase family protein [Kofleriaceae bacterium]|nr:phytanoyl-CoA dioxygenase family protein [Kofleriaceae bacterium]